MASLTQFLIDHKATDKNKTTHTRIGNKELNVFPGKYTIPPSALSTFYKLYYNEVIKNKKHEYLTEKQMASGPILVDLDFRYETTVEERQHSEDHILDIIELYISKISKIFDITEEFTFKIYVSEKPDVVLQDLLTKDGIHLVFAISADRACQQILRNEVLTDISDILSDLELTNSAEDVIDVGICKGYTNWQLYGSRKPGCEAYEVTKIYNCTISSDKFDLDAIDPSLFNKDDFININAQNTKNLVLTINSNWEKTYQDFKKKTTKKKRKRLKIQDYNDVANIKSQKELDTEIDVFLEHIDHEDYLLKETHQYAMCLGESYYNPYDKWIKVGWALHNTSKSLFLTWLKFSSKSEKFSYEDIPDLQEKWEMMNQDNTTNLLTDRSIRYWAFQDNFQKADEVKMETLSYLIDQVRDNKQTAEYDIAMILYYAFKGKYKCASVSKRQWYSFKQISKHSGHGRWEEIDSGTSLRLQISQFLAKEFINKSRTAFGIHQQVPEDDIEKQNDLKKQMARYSEIAIALKKTQFKNNIIRECLDLFYERNFVDKLDQNPYLLCFNNCVVDFKTKEVRDAEPEDYLCNCTNIDYIEFDEKNKDHVKIMGEINAFMKQLFPVEELCEYMWDHLASTLIGTNENQTFNMYTGVGRNGKSKLVELMECCLGDYKGTVPITLITSKRTSIGSASPEIAQLKGKRYAVMQEPSKGQTLNEGIMKEITGGDPVQGRALYHDTITFIPQFTLAVCTNNLFDIKSDDDGTWRRIRVCDFLSKFVADPKPSKKSPYEFKIDKKINEKFDSWKEIFMWMLVQRAFKTNGLVKDCQMVLNTSNKYRCSQDQITEFINECIVKEDGQRIYQKDVKPAFVNWYEKNYDGRMPKIQDVYSYLNKHIGDRKETGWKGYTIKIVDDVDDDDDV